MRPIKSTSVKYYLIAGEASGDLHGSNLMKAILQIAPDSEFRYWGGDKMQAVGGKLVKHYRDLAFMGFAEVLLNLHTIFSNLKYCKKDIVNYNPDILILIDYPGFNLRIAEFVKKQGIKVVYYISPQIWAWKRNRVFKIKKVVDKMLVILPFEKDFYAKYNVNVDFVGHPLLDAIENEKQITKTIFLSKNNLNNKSIIALLPGSRKQEVRAMLTTMLRLTNDYPNYQFIIAGINTLDRKFYSDIIGNNDIKLLFNNTNNILQFADAAIVTSGTATLETALIGTPEVVCYKGNSISYEIAKRVVRVKYISLVNLIMDKEVVVELIQKDFNYSSLKTALDEILFDDDKRIEIASNYKKLKIELGRKGASMRAAEIIVSIND